MVRDMGSTSKLSGAEVKRFQEALLSAFPTRSALAQMVRVGLDENLEAIAAEKNLSVAVFELIGWAEAQGRIRELIAAARQANQGNAILRSFAEDQASRDYSRSQTASTTTEPIHENTGIRAPAEQLERARPTSPQSSVAVPLPTSVSRPTPAPTSSLHVPQLSPQRSPPTGSGWRFVLIAALVVVLLAATKAILDPDYSNPTRSNGGPGTSASVQMRHGPEGSAGAEPLPSSVQTVPPTPASPEEDARLIVCRRWLEEVARGRWFDQLGSEIGNNAALAKRIALRTLIAADLKMKKDDVPCSGLPLLADAAFDAFVRAAQNSAAAWAAVTGISDDLRVELTERGKPLSAQAKQAFRARVEATANRALGTAQKAQDLDSPKQWCALVDALAAPRPALCTALETKSARLTALAQQQEERCQKAQQGFGECQVECTFRYDLFDKRMNDCDRRCEERTALRDVS
jgi:hypothetical protein